MKKSLSFSLAFIVAATAFAQSSTYVTGSVTDKGSGQRLSGTVVRQNKDENQTITDAAGKFKLTLNRATDTLIFSHVGFKTCYIPLTKYVDDQVVMLEEYALQLKTVTIMSRSLNVKEVEAAMRLIRDNLYAHEAETTNAMYNLFLSALEESESDDIFQRCNYDLRGYSSEQKEYLARYSSPLKGVRKKTDSTEHDFSQFPAVNVPHEGAVLFCEWLTQQYNSSPAKKKYKKVKFRLPTRAEWQIAALGYPKFQSWKLDENYVEVVIPPDSVTAMMKGNRSRVPVGNNNVWYPWFNAYNYRKKPYNHMNCYLGNFKIDASKPVCNNVFRPGGDGWTMMSRTKSYFPNDMGFYDVVGNVAEMIDENFIACGGSWNDVPSHATIHSVKTYKRPNDTIGFRIFMEVLER